MTADFAAPPARATNDRKLGWFRQAWQEGERHLQAQRPFKAAKEAMKILGGELDENITPETSTIQVNPIKRQTREVVATLAKMNPSWWYSAGAEELDPIARSLDKCHEDWWNNTSAPRDVRKWIQYAAGLGTGYISPTWRKSRGRYGVGEIKLDVFGPNDVRQIQPVRNFDLDEAYMVIITDEVPINRARAQWPLSADKIIPDRDHAMAAGNSKAFRLIDRIASRYGAGSHVHRLFGMKRQQSERDVESPVVDVHYAYIADNSINETDREIEFGPRGASWHYRVPYKGQRIKVGNPAENLYRDADWEDCMLYPFRRLVAFTNSTILHDDTSPHWHGKVPLAKLALDDWPWEMLGYGLTGDGQSIQREINMVARGIGDRVNNALRPAMLGDKNAWDEATFNKFNPRTPGVKVLLDRTLSSKPVETALPPELYRVHPEYLQYLEWCMARMEEQSAVADMRSLAKARQLPSDQTLEKMQEIGGPLVTDMTGNVEDGMKKLGNLVGHMFFQHYSFKRRFTLSGKDGNKMMFTFDPFSLWPKEIREASGMTTQADRAEVLIEFMQRFEFNIDPASLHEITQTTYKMMLLALWRDPEFPIDPKTIADAFGIKNFGMDDKGSSVIDRWEEWMAKLTEFQAVTGALAQAKASVLQAQMLAQAGLGDPAMGAAGEAAAEPGAPGGARQGRPPTGQEAPSLQTKDGGTRPVVSESG